MRPEQTRVDLKGSVVNWRFGPGTINPTGDFYDGERYVDSSYFHSPGEVAQAWGSSQVIITSPDPELVLDEGI
jgi:hypothetical protein